MLWDRMYDKCTQLKTKGKLKYRLQIIFKMTKLSKILTDMHSRFNTIFGPFAYTIIAANSFCCNSSRFSLGTSCQCFSSFVCNVVAPKNWISDDYTHARKQRQIELILINFFHNFLIDSPETEFSQKEICVWLPCPIALNPIQTTMLAGSVVLWWANRVHSIAAVQPNDKTRSQLPQVISYRLLHPLCCCCRCFCCCCCFCVRSPIPNNLQFISDKFVREFYSAAFNFRCIASGSGFIQC